MAPLIKSLSCLFVLIFAVCNNCAYADFDFPKEDRKAGHNWETKEDGKNGIDSSNTVFNIFPDIIGRPIHAGFDFDVPDEDRKVAHNWEPKEDEKKDTDSSNTIFNIFPDIIGRPIHAEFDSDVLNEDRNVAPKEDENKDTDSSNTIFNIFPDIIGRPIHAEFGSDVFNEDRTEVHNREPKEDKKNETDSSNTGVNIVPDIDRPTNEGIGFAFINAIFDIFNPDREKNKDKDNDKYDDKKNNDKYDDKKNNGNNNDKEDDDDNGTKTNVIPDVDETLKEGIEFELYTRNNPKNPEYIELHGPHKSMRLRNFDSRRPTKIAIHGWRSDGQGILDLKDEYLRFEDVNFIMVNWTEVDSSLYPIAQARVKHVGQWVASLIDFLTITQFVEMSDIHLIGHSLGAHIAGYAGKSVSWGKVGRISGLDPAGVLFQDEADSRLDKGDAQFVDVIHTCGNVLGYADPIGHVDFYPNGGTCVQPGCGLSDITTGTCSHNRAYGFYQESIMTKVGFKAYPCKGLLDDGYLPSGPHVLMGYHLPSNSSGVFCLKTSSSSPFALEQETRNPYLPVSRVSEELKQEVDPRIILEKYLSADLV